MAVLFYTAAGWSESKQKKGWTTCLACNSSLPIPACGYWEDGSCFFIPTPGRCTCIMAAEVLTLKKKKKNSPEESGVVDQRGCVVSALGGFQDSAA